MAYIVDFFQHVAMGEAAPQFTSASRHARHYNVAATKVLVSALHTTALPHMPTGAVNVEVLSANAGDAAAGAGARSLRLFGLDDNFREVQEVVNLNGLTPAAALTKFRRLTAANVESCGSYGGSNLGNITVRQAAAGPIFFFIAAGNGRSQCSHMCVPAGETWYVHDVHMSTGTDQAEHVTVVMWGREGADIIAPPFKPTLLLTEFRGHGAFIDYEAGHIPRILPEKTDIWADVIATSNASVSVVMGYVIVK